MEDINAAAMMDPPQMEEQPPNQDSQPKEQVPQDPEKRKEFILRKIDEEFAKTYDNKTLFWVLALVSFCMILVNVDHGSLPGCIEAVEKKLAI